MKKWIAAALLIGLALPVSATVFRGAVSLVQRTSWTSATGASSGDGLYNKNGVPTWHLGDGSVDKTISTGGGGGGGGGASLGNYSFSTDTMNMPASATFQGASATSPGLTISTDVADGANTALILNNTTALTNPSAVLLSLQNALTPLLNVFLNSSDGVSIRDGGGAARVGLSTNNGATLTYANAGFSAGAGSASIGDGTGSVGLSGGNLVFTIFQGTPDADGTRDWGVLSTRWRIGAFKRLIPGAQSMATSATPAFDCTAGDGLIHIGNIAANVTGPTMVNGSDGEHCTIIFRKDGTSNTYTISGWGSNVHVTGTITMGAATNSLTVLDFVWDSILGTPAWVLTHASVNDL